ncbi:MAG TPA: SGNH/GDSL hydrolase family protein [Usitatibacter sp.]|nr:SGNH/GDSL hydrolase family protein [Usitatibacter sp.]
MVFGDSLSDSGNTFFAGQCHHTAGTHNNNVPPGYDLDDLLTPNAAYARGGHHFTNGPTWIEDVAKALGSGVNANPAFGSDNPLATNYAFSGARAHDRDGGTEVCKDLGYQVTAFLDDFGGTAPSGTLYVIEVGGNDINDATTAAAILILSGSAPSDAIATVAPGLVAAAQSVAGRIEQLHAAGARNFLVLEAPDLGMAPAVLGIPGLSGVATYLSTFYNTYLDLALDGEVGLDGIDLQRFSFFTAIHQIAGSFTDITTPCVMPDVAPFVCANPDGHLFWDAIHPTEAAHALIAEKVEAFLAP